MTYTLHEVVLALAVNVQPVLRCSKQPPLAAVKVTTAQLNPKVKHATLQE